MSQTIAGVGTSAMSQASQTGMAPGPATVIRKLAEPGPFGPLSCTTTCHEPRTGMRIFVISVLVWLRGANVKCNGTASVPRPGSTTILPVRGTLVSCGTTVTSTSWSDGGGF